MNNIDLNELVAVFSSVEDTLANFASSNSFLDTLTIAFGSQISVEQAKEVQQQWANKNFTNLPSIEIRPGEEINYANAAFFRDPNIIYLSQDYLNQNLTNPQTITNVLLEEIGHWVDAQINVEDRLWIVEMKPLRYWAAFTILLT